MCRPEKPLTTSNKALRELQEWLRGQRERTRQGYRALSVRAGCHATTLQRAASGETVPKLPTVLNYARACDASPEEAKRLWKRARHEESRLARRGRGLSAPRPGFIRDFVDLSAALVELYEKAGSPPLRTMEQRAGGHGRLARSAAHRIVTKQVMPRGLQQFRAYLRACEVPETDWPEWEAAWTRAWRHEKHDDFVALGVATGSAIVEAAATDAWDSLRTSVGRLLFRDHPDYLQDRATDVDLIVTAGDGTRRALPIQVKHHEAPRRVRRRGPGAASRYLAERPVPGQLSIPISVPEPEAVLDW